MKGLQILKLVNIDDGNTTIKKFKYPVSIKREFLKEIGNFEKSIIQLGEQSLLLVYVCGETWMQEGKIWIDMGSHSFCIEDKINKICFGGDKTAIWSIYNCSREVKLARGASTEVKQFKSEKENVKANAPYFVTFACDEGQMLPENRDFAQDLLNYLGRNLK